MYKTHFRHWNIRKYHKGDNRRTRISKQSRVAGHEDITACSSSDRIENNGNKSYHWKRHSLTSEESIATKRQATYLRQCRGICDCSRPPGKLALPAVPERFLILLQNYLKGSFESGMWKVNRCHSFCSTTKMQSDAIPHLDALRDKCSLACILFNDDYFQEAGQTLISATAGIQEILRAEDPITFNKLFLLIKMLVDDRPEIALAIVRQFAAMGKIILGEKHPFPFICKWLTSLDWSNRPCFEDFIRRCLRALGDCFEESLGLAHKTALMVRLHLFGPLDAKRDSGSHELASQRPLHNDNPGLGQQERRGVKVRSSLTSLDYAQDYLTQAIDIGHRIVALAESVLAEFDQTDYRIESLYWAAWSDYELSETRTAVASLCDAINSQLAERKSCDGQFDPMIRLIHDWQRAHRPTAEHALQCFDFVK